MKKIPLLDLGNVVVKVDFTPFLSWLAGKSGRDMGQMGKLLSSSLFFELEFGQMSRQEFARRLSLWCGADLARAELEEKFCSIFPGPVEGMEEALPALASQTPVYCLSNTNEIHLEYLKAHYPVMKNFTRIFASHEMHKRKPYPGIYQAVAEELGVPASGVVFFDDLPQNVEGALRAGMDAFVFSGAEAFRGQLKDFQEMGDKATGGTLP
jgi:FMN phosphatase YigB (HAD superfamily)